MDNIGRTSGASIADTLSSKGETVTKEVSFQHSQLGNGTVAGQDTSMFEEVAMTLASLKKFKTKDDKKDKSDLQKLLDASRKRVPDMPEVEKLNDCLNKLKEQLKSGNLSDEQIKNAINNYSEDATHQYLALEDLVDYLQSSGSDLDQQLANKLTAYNQSFYTENQLDIQSGINIAELSEGHVANDLFATHGEARDSWRSTLNSALNQPDFENHTGKFINFALQQCGGYEKLKDWLQVTTQLWGNELDLAESDQCMDPTRMLYARKQLEMTFWFNTFHELCDEIENKLPRFIEDELQNS